VELGLLVEEPRVGRRVRFRDLLPHGVLTKDFDKFTPGADVMTLNSGS
jgi:hypothetical protein